MVNQKTANNRLTGNKLQSNLLTVASNSSNKYGNGKQVGKIGIQ
jgi:hypothetical protein